MSFLHYGQKKRRLGAMAASGGRAIVKTVPATAITVAAVIIVTIMYTH